jgi:hypothetical protein
MEFLASPFINIKSASRDKHSAVVLANAGTHSLRSSEAEDISNLRQQLA